MTIDRNDTHDPRLLTGGQHALTGGARRAYVFVVSMLVCYASIEIYRRTAFTYGTIDVLERDLIGLFSFGPLLTGAWVIRGQIPSTPRIRDLLFAGLLLHTLSQVSDVLEEFSWAASSSFLPLRLFANTFTDIVLTVSGSSLIVACSFYALVSTEVARRRIEEERRLLDRETQERRAAEAELLRAHQELERRVLERTRELAEANQRLAEQVVEVELAHKEADESRYLLREMERITECGAWELDTATDTIQCTERFRHILGFPDDATITLNDVLDRFSAEVRLTLLDLRHRAQHEGAGWDMEIPFTRLDGARRWIRTMGLPRSGPGGPRARITGTIQDITPQRAIPLEISESSNLLQAVIKSAPLFVWILDPKGNVILNTGAGLGKLGLQPGEIIGINVLEQYAGNESVLGIVRRALEGAPCSGLVEDQGHFFQTTYSPIHDDEGRLTGVIGVAMDVTEQRRTEHRRRQQQKMESLGVLAGGIAHDFNNILYAMDGFAALAAKEVREHPTASECLAEMRIAVQRAVALVERILAFSRHEEPRFGSVDVAECANRAIRMLERSLPDNVCFRFEQEADTPLAWGDPGYLERILSNLVANAMYAMRNHGGEIRIRIAPGQLEHPGRVSREGVLIEVSDSGGGFDPEMKERMFEPFYSTKPARDGTGLGLAIVHSLVESLGGVVDAHSEPGHGSTFSVCIPVAGESATTDVPQDLESALVLPGPPRRVLVVEDEPQVRHLLRMVLTDGGHECTCCPGGEEALDLLAGGYLPDLVIADLTMPGMGGLDLLKRMRSIGHAIPVILCSGHYSELNRAGLAELGVAEKIRKPVDPVALLALVARATQHLEEVVGK